MYNTFPVSFIFLKMFTSLRVLNDGWKGDITLFAELAERMEYATKGIRTEVNYYNSCLLDWERLLSWVSSIIHREGRVNDIECYQQTQPLVLLCLRIINILQSTKKKIPNMFTTRRLPLPYNYTIGNLRPDGILLYNTYSVNPCTLSKLNRQF